MDARLRKAAVWFAANGATRVGYAMADGLAMARAERALAASDVMAVWADDDDPDWSFVETWSEVDGKRWKRSEHVAETCRLVIPCQRCIDDGLYGSAGECRHAEIIASLSGIIDADPSYRRVIQAELALEAIDRIVGLNVDDWIIPA